MLIKSCIYLLVIVAFRILTWLYIQINECDNNPCHPTAACLNTPGSFKCLCRKFFKLSEETIRNQHLYLKKNWFTAAGLIGEPYEKGCRDAQECKTSEQCPENMACLPLANGQRKCTDPCVEVSQKCGPRAKCQVAGYQGMHCRYIMLCFKLLFIN